MMEIYYWQHFVEWEKTYLSFSPLQSVSRVLYLSEKDTEKTSVFSSYKTSCGALERNHGTSLVSYISVSILFATITEYRSVNIFDGCVISVVTTVAQYHSTTVPQ